MLVKMIFKYVLLCIGLLFSLHVSAVQHKIVTLSANGGLVTGPADRQTFAASIVSMGNAAYNNACSSTNISYDVSEVRLVSLMPYTGRNDPATVSFAARYLYDIGVPGLAYTPYIIGNWMQGEMASTNGTGLIPGTTVAWKGYMPNASRTSAFYNMARGNVLKDAGRILEGSTTVSAQDYYRFECYDTDGTLQETTTIRGSQYIITSQVTSCTPNTSNYLIRMKDLNLDEVEKASVNTIFESVERNFTLTCPTGINLFLTVNDLVDSGNLTQISKLTSDSTGKGVGFQASTLAGRVFTFSPPGSTPGIPGRDQVFIRGTTSNNEAVSFSLKFNYLKTDNEISEGKVRSILGITYSYQ